MICLGYEILEVMGRWPLNNGTHTKLHRAQNTSQTHSLQKTDKPNDQEQQQDFDKRLLFGPTPSSHQEVRLSTLIFDL